MSSTLLRSALLLGVIGLFSIGAYDYRRVVQITADAKALEAVNLKLKEFDSSDIRDRTSSSAFEESRLLHEKTRLERELAGVEDKRPASRETMQIILSLLLTGVSLFVILASRYKPQEKHWAYGTIGTILGFWIRP